MQPLTDAQRAVLTAPDVEVGFGADLVDDAGRPIEDLSDDVVAFTVERSSHATIHGSCQLTLLRDLVWGVDRVRPWITIGPDRYDLGVFIPTTPDIQAGDTPRGREVSGVDLLWLLDREVGDTYVVPAGTSYLDAIRTALTDAGVGATTLLLQGDRQSTTLTAPAVWLLTDQPSTWLRVVNDLLAQIGYRGLWVDEAGRYRSEPYQPPSERGVEWTFDTTDPETNIVEVDRTLSADVWGQVNWWRFVRSGSATEPVEGDGIYTVDRVDGLPRRRTVFVDAADQAALVAEGDRIVAEDTANVRLVSLACGPLPFGHQDLVRLRDPELALDARCLVRRWSLSSDGSASAELEVL